MRNLLGSLVLLALGCSGVALAQPADVRVVRAWDEPVKLDDGTEAVYRHEVTYDYATGRTVRRTSDAAGREVERVDLAPPSAPLPGEIDEALAIIYADGALGDLAARSAARIEGGFVLFEAQDARCAPPARCLQFDVMAQSRTESLQFVVVDLHTGTIIDRDRFPDL